MTNNHIKSSRVKLKKNLYAPRIEGDVIKFYKFNSLEELIDKVKTKRYTYNRIKRMFVHILCSFTKEEASRCKEIRYIRILGFNNKGKSYLSSIKKSINLRRRFRFI